MTALRIAVIGGGAAGLSAAESARRKGADVTLFEGRKLGGECTWSGCVPSKALLAVAKHVHSMRSNSTPGVGVAGISVDMAGVMGHVQSVIQAIASGEDAEHYRQMGIEVVSEVVRFSTPRSLDYGGTPFSFDRAIICTGAEPAVPPIEGFRELDFYTNESIFSLQELPESLLILGAGPIGLELGQAFRRLGSSVDIVDLAPRILPMVDEDIAEIVHSALEREGIKFHMGESVAMLEREGQGIRAVLGGESTHLHATHLLVAAGRRPRTKGLGLEDIGITLAHNAISVDQGMRTSVDGIYAAGDVTAVMPFTHVAAYQARIAADNAVGKHRKASYRDIPWAVYVDPPVAGVGRRTPDSGEQILTRAFASIDRAVLEGKAEGLMKCGLKAKPILGTSGGGEVAWAQVVGYQADELIHEFAMAMHTHSFAGRLAQAIHAYPTMSLGIQQLIASAFIGEQ